MGMQLGQTYTGRGHKLLYKPYMESLLSSLTEAAPGLKCQQLHADFSSQKSDKGREGAEVHNWLFCSDRLRRIRFTYFDAGSAGQAFNSLLYPDFRFDYPLLGIDLLAFGKGKLIFYRSDRGAADPLLQVPGGQFFDTYMGYVTSYLDWLHLLDPVEDLHFGTCVRSQQASYDIYSSSRDPAIKMFSLYFGDKWSEQFTKEFLFPLA
ncbi:hypothetical protein L7F22_042346 [Adiantum nelumboides]|nr:hypothetical protein [Adiantum nelumboides]